MEPTTPVTLRLAGLVDHIAREVQNLTGSAALADCARFAPVYILLVLPTLCLLRMVWRKGGRQLLWWFAGSLYISMLFAFSCAAWLPLDILIRTPLVDPPYRLPPGVKIEICNNSGHLSSSGAGPFLTDFSFARRQSSSVFAQRRNLADLIGSHLGGKQVDLLKLRTEWSYPSDCHIVIFVEDGVRKAMVLSVRFGREGREVGEDLFVWRNGAWIQEWCVRTKHLGRGVERLCFFVVLLCVPAPGLLFILAFAKLLVYKNRPAAGPQAIPWIPIVLILVSFGLALWVVYLFMYPLTYLSNSYFYVPLGAGLLPYIAFRLASAGGLRASA
jgi:hypothetical protein